MSSQRDLSGMEEDNFDIRASILEILLPLLNVPPANRSSVLKLLLPDSKIRKVIKYQILKEAGTEDVGQLMIVLRGLLDSYYECPFTGKYWGRHLYYRHDTIFDPELYFEHSPRTDYLRALEPSVLLVISYRAIHQLSDKFIKVESSIQELRIVHAQELLDYHLRNSLPGIARVRTFLQKHPSLPSRTTEAICAMHNQMSRFWYASTVKKISNY